MLKTAAIIFGIVFLIIGIGGFIPGLTTSDGMELGLFMVGPVHNFIHIASGAAALLCAFAGADAARKYFQIFGIIYALVAVIGFFYGNKPLMGMVEHNTADIFLHIAIAAVALYLGFGAKETAAARRA
jgi:hypothetical protein